MPTFKEIGRDYAAQVKAAVEADARQNLEYVKKAYARERITADSLPSTHLVAALKKIARAVKEDWRSDGQPLSEEQEDEILRQAGAALGLENPEDFVYLTKGASNDAYMQMVNYISGVLQASGKK